MPRCKATKKDGSPCPVEARPSGYCWVHDPELARSRARGRREGGKARSKPAAVLPATAPDLPIRTVADVVGLLAESINRTRKGELDPKVGNAVGYLSSVLLRALQDSDLAARLAELREDLEGLKHDERQRTPRVGTTAGGDPVPEGGGGRGPGPPPGRPVPDPEPGGTAPGPLADGPATFPLFPPADAL
jgi:hypothetical protein